MTVSLGFDPEFFVANPDSPDMPVPVCGKLGGTKESPLQFRNAHQDFNYHEDNVLAEVGVRPVNNSIRAYEGLVFVMDRLEAQLGRQGLTMSNVFGEHEFMSFDLASKQAKEFGCEGDYDAYTGGVAPRTGAPDFRNYRFAGGHIHLGGDFNCPPFVVALFMDLCIGAVFIMQHGVLPQRSQWYGQAGVFRPKPYGIEYRTLDNRWLSDRNDMYNVASRTQMVGNWLEVTAPSEIKRTMEAINWLAVREYVQTGKVGGYRGKTGQTYPTPIRNILNTARSRGLSI